MKLLLLILPLSLIGCQSIELKEIEEQLQNEEPRNLLYQENYLVEIKSNTKDNKKEDKPEDDIVVEWNS